MHATNGCYLAVGTTKCERDMSLCIAAYLWSLGSLAYRLYYSGEEMQKSLQFLVSLGCLYKDLHNRERSFPGEGMKELLKNYS